MKKEHRIREEIKSSFDNFQSRNIEMVEKIAGSKSLHQELARNNRDQNPFYFDFLTSNAKNEFSLELYNNDRRSLAWAVNRGPLIDTIDLKSSVCSFIIEGPIYTYMILSVPIYDGQKLLGYLVGKRLFEVNYPLNNRFINSSTFSQTFTSGLDFAPEFNFDDTSDTRTEGAAIVIGLNDASGKQIGKAFLPKPSLQDSTDELQREIRFLKGIILVLLVFWFLNSGFISLKGYKRLIFYSFVIWGIRYLLIWMDFPSAVFDIDIFKPGYFASTFGYGLSKSIGDLFITSAALFINIIIIGYQFYFVIRKGTRTGYFHFSKNKIIAVSAVIILVLIQLLLLRGFTATIRSVIYDSTVSYTDARFILPSFELTVILISVLLIAISLVLTFTGIIIIIKTIISGHIKGVINSQISWFIIAVITAIGSLLFGIFAINPLLSQSTRLIIFSIIFIYAVWFNHITENSVKLQLLKIFTPTVIICAFIVLLPLGQNIHELEQSEVELAANRILRPTDAWMTTFLNRALDELSDSETVDILTLGDDDEIEKIAFTKWAKSILSREGSDCSVSYLSPKGKVLSEFVIGVSSPIDKKLQLDNLPAGRSILAEEKSQHGILTQWYTGFSPIVDKTGGMIGTVKVEVSGSKSAFLERENFQILRNYSQEKFRSVQKSLILSEYFDGKLINSTDEDFSREKSLPGVIKDQKSSQNAFWLNEIVNSTEFETYYFQSRAESEKYSWFSLSIRSFSQQWVFFLYARYLFFYILCTGIVILVVILVQILRRHLIIIQFRDRLIWGFILVSILPVLILAYYNRQYVSSRAIENTVKQLREGSRTIAAELGRRYNLYAPVAIMNLGNGECMDVADDLNTDFNIYYLSDIYASSKPEMFEAELIDRSLSAGAFKNIILDKKLFYQESQVFGNLSYIVGYRPLLAENGSIIGVISVPTLYKQNEIDEELAARNVYLYGIYIIVFAFSIAMGAIIAGRISSPIRRLQVAAQKISTGNLHIELESKRKDEIGELENTFVKMAKDLEKTQSEMIRAQREAAWRDMAKQVAHEIKNPLTPIKLSIQHLNQAYKDKKIKFDHVLEQVTTTVLEQIETLSHIASVFSDYGRMPEHKLEELNVHSTIEEAVNLFSQQAKIVFEIILSAKSFVIISDREELRRAFINIIRNSIQAIKENGQIIIKTASDENAIYIEIVDDGQGIPNEIKERIFEPNFSTKTDGMGLGLAIVKKTIDLSGGKISVFSEAGKGTTVKISLPIVREKNIP